MQAGVQLPQVHLPDHRRDDCGNGGRAAVLPGRVGAWRRCRPTLSEPSAPTAPWTSRRCSTTWSWRPTPTRPTASRPGSPASRRGWTASRWRSRRLRRWPWVGRVTSRGSRPISPASTRQCLSSGTHHALLAFSVSILLLVWKCHCKHQKNYCDCYIWRTISCTMFTQILRKTCLQDCRLVVLVNAAVHLCLNLLCFLIVKFFLEWRILNRTSASRNYVSQVDQYQSY